MRFTFLLNNLYSTSTVLCTFMTVTCSSQNSGHVYVVSFVWYTIQVMVILAMITNPFGNFVTISSNTLVIESTAFLKCIFDWVSISINGVMNDIKYLLIYRNENTTLKDITNWWSSFSTNIIFLLTSNSIVNKFGRI